MRKIEIKKILILMLIIALPIGLFLEGLAHKNFYIPHITFIILSILILIDKKAKKILVLINVLALIFLQMIFFREMQILPNLFQFCNFILLSVYITEKMTFDYFIKLIKQNLNLIFSINLIIVILIIYSFLSKDGWVILWDGKQFKSFFGYPHDTCNYLVGLQSLFAIITFLTTNKVIKRISIVNVYLLAVLSTFTNARTPFLLSILIILFFTYKLLNKKYIKIYLIMSTLIMITLIFILIGWIDMEFISNLPIINKFISTAEAGNITNSRGLIWDSIKYYTDNNYSILDYLIGNGSGISNYINYNILGISLWSHNDFLEILVSYGLFGMLLYLKSLINIYIKNRNIIFISTIVFMAIWNGFYISPQIIAFLPFILINAEKYSSKS